ncbi:hypothetical protein INS49_003601 [Diaporthe citri]|uniref:uncharacterized protein n=1 Tax=Diaporthe citri TaxID=83186 RepID=UPI001C820A2F|nr:uncharacterized protein INS49_003601 [Diaporthe citri]KAG6355639.1 hypothetical protein INS49_003601 [Diaporthe citri]
MADQIPAENEKKPEKEAQRENAALTLDTLPRNITSLILATITIDVNVPYVVSPSTFQTSATRKKEDASARRDLVSLCMVSKRMISKTRPALYRNILIDDLDTLILLYRTFLEKPQLGIFVKRMSLNICHGDKDYNSDYGELCRSINLRPLLSYAQNGFEELRKTTHARRATEFYEIALERLYTLHFKVLSRTRNLESLDLNVHPQTEMRNICMDTQPIYLDVVGRVLRSLWRETSPCLSRLKELQLIGKEKACAYRGNRWGYAALICRCFLSLPELEQLVWFNHAHGWFDAFSRRTVSGSGKRLRADAKSLRTLKLGESLCLPHDLATLCSVFPNLESLSVDTDSNQCRERLRSLVHRPRQLHANGSPNSGLVIKYLTDRFATLENLTTLDLDLHYACDISRSLGPSGTLSLAALPNLQTLAVPFHFFVREGPDGHHKAVSPTSVLPRALKTLRIVTCFWCIGYRVYKDPRIVKCSCGAYRIRGYASDRAPCRYQHPDAVLGFLEGIANPRVESFPDLSNICYEEGKPYPITHHHITWKCPHPPTEILMHSNRDTPDALRLSAVSESLRQSGVVFKMRDTTFGCRQVPMRYRQQNRHGSYFHQAVRKQ